jgi:O-antigen/teichoic acid export membrane protein
VGALNLNSIKALFSLWFLAEWSHRRDGLLAPTREAPQFALPRNANSIALILARISSSGLGFLTWILTARLYAESEVGIAAGVVAAMMLGVQAALLGIGSAVVVLYPAFSRQPSSLVNTALNLVIGFSTLAALLFVCFASLFFKELQVVGANLLYTFLFLAITIFGAVNVLMDHLSIAVRRGDQVFVRNVLFGVCTMAAVVALPLLVREVGSLHIVTAWATGGLAACCLGALQLRMSLFSYGYRVELPVVFIRRLLHAGSGNYLLTLAERAPNWVLPILITEFLSPADNAYWYSAWMMAWVVFIIPISIGQNLFAEIAQQPQNLKGAIKSSIRLSFSLGTVAVIAALITASLLLSLLGPGYAAAGTTPLRILVLSLFPFTLLQMYYALCRALGKLKEGTATAVVTAVIGVGAAAYSGPRFGLEGMAITWLVVCGVTALWASYRLHRFMKPGELSDILRERIA